MASNDKGHLVCMYVYVCILSMYCQSPFLSADYFHEMDNKSVCKAFFSKTA